MKTSILLVALCLCIAIDKSVSQPCTYKKVRLYDDGSGANNQSGMLQICNQQRRWTAVCDYNWKNPLSVKVCRDLGYKNPKPITYLNNGVYWNTFGYVLASSSSNCGTRQRLADCLSRTSFYLRSTYYCSKNRDTIFINCTFSPPGGCSGSEIRLYRNSTNSGGMLQMCYQGRWTAVCDFSWGCAESIVACRQLGYTNALPKYRYNSGRSFKYGGWSEFGYPPYSSCSVTFTSLSQCNRFSASYKTNPRYCDPVRDTVNLQCLTQPTYNDSCSTNYAVRLVNGTTEDEGRIEVCYRNKWTTFCGLNYVNPKIGSTICNQLGYGGNSFGTLIYDGRFGDGETVMYSRRIYCRNEYNSIQYCSITVVNNAGSCISSSSPLECSYNRLGLRCYKPQNCNEGDVRLVNGKVEWEGRLEICANGVWGSVCSRSFALSAAYVACLQIGHTNVNGAVIDKFGKYGFGDGPIVYNDLECFGHETNLNDCNKDIYPNFYCPARYVVGLRCLDKCKEGEIRLTNGSHAYEGTVEVCLDNTWCLVAQHGWDDADARVVCKQIGGYNYSAGVAKFNSTYGHPRRAVRYSNVHCNGNEKELTDCTHHTFEFDYGRTYDVEVAGVDCGVLSTPTVSTTAISSNTVIIQQTAQAVRGSGSDGDQGTVFISGILFLVIGLSLLVIAIIIMVFVLLRMKKLSLKSNNTTEVTARMSSMPDDNEYDIKPPPSGTSYDEELLS